MQPLGNDIPLARFFASCSGVRFATPRLPGPVLLSFLLMALESGDPAALEASRLLRLVTESPPGLPGPSSRESGGAIAQMAPINFLRGQGEGRLDGKPCARRVVRLRCGSVGGDGGRDPSVTAGTQLAKRLGRSTRRSARVAQSGAAADDRTRAPPWGWMLWQQDIAKDANGRGGRGRRVRKNWTTAQI